MAFGIDPNFNWQQFGGRALSDIGYGLGQSPTVWGGLAAGARRNTDLRPERDAATQAEQDRKAALLEKNQTSEWIKANFPQYSNLPAAQAWSAAMADLTAKRNAASGSDMPASIQEYNFYAKQTQAAGGTPKPYDEWRQGSNQTVRAGLGQPVPLRNKQTGETVPFMPMSDGTYMNPLSQQVADDSWEFDPAYIAAQKAQGSAVGTQVGNMQFNMPAAKQNVDTELFHIDQVLGNKAGFDQSFGNVGGVSINGVGLPNQWIPTMPNTPKAGFQAQIEQVKGENFLAAYTALKGAGAITEMEGQQAKAAMARLDTAQSKEDFVKALTELQDILKRGYDRMSQQAGMLPSIGGQAPQQTGSGYKVLSVE